MEQAGSHSKQGRGLGFILVLWAAISVAVLVLCKTRHTTPLHLFQQGVIWLDAQPMAPLIYCLVFLVRPLTLIPVALFSMAAGYCFGFGWGLLWANLAALGSAMVGYLLGRWLGLRPGLPGVALMAQHGALSVVLLRWCFLPFDPISYLGGAFRLTPWRFALASFLGNLPGSISFVLMGASLEGPLDGKVPINWRLQAVSWVLLGGMMGLARWLRHRLANPKPGEETPSESDTQDSGPQAETTQGDL